jgi:glycosyltransferase involved in cell wall biosynthesis
LEPTPETSRRRLAGDQGLADIAIGATEWPALILLTKYSLCGDFESMSQEIRASIWSTHGSVLALTAGHAQRRSRAHRTGVLFVSSAERPGADTFVHSLIVRSLDRLRFDVHVAGSSESLESSAPGYVPLAAIPDVQSRPNVIFLGHRPDMPALLAASDLFALPSDEEPFGLVFAEEMAMKKPVIALANGGTPEVVDHGLSGLLSRPGDVRALAANVGALLRDPALRARMGQYGREQVERRFTAERLASDTACVYRSVVRSGSCDQHPD